MASGANSKLEEWQVLVLDLEASGLVLNQSAWALQIGALYANPAAWQGRSQEVKVFQALCDPMYYTDVDAAFRVHRIDISKVRGQPLLSQRLQELSNFLNDHRDRSKRTVLVTYNGHCFDLPVVLYQLHRDDPLNVARVLDGLGIDVCVDLMELARGLSSQYKPPVILRCGKLSTNPLKYTLEKLYKNLYRRPPPYQLHDALNDCRITLQILQHEAMQPLFAGVLQGDSHPLRCDFQVFVRRFLSQFKPQRNLIQKALSKKRERSKSETSALSEQAA